MGQGQERPQRRLKLSRETLQQLEPSSAEAAGVRGAQAETSVCGEGYTCHTVCNCSPGQLLRYVLGVTHHSWGCVGQIVIDTGDPARTVIDLDLHPNDELLRFMDKRGGDTE